MFNQTTYSFRKVNEVLDNISNNFVGLNFDRNNYPHHTGLGLYNDSCILKISLGDNMLCTISIVTEPMVSGWALVETMIQQCVFTVPDECDNERDQVVRHNDENDFMAYMTHLCNSCINYSPKEEEIVLI